MNQDGVETYVMRFCFFPPIYFAKKHCCCAACWTGGLSLFLGWVFYNQDGVAIVEQVSKYNGVGGKAGGPFPGDELTEVAGVRTSHLSYDGVVERIRSSPRPVTLRFR